MAAHCRRGLGSRRLGDVAADIVERVEVVEPDGSVEDRPPAGGECDPAPAIHTVGHDAAVGSFPGEPEAR